MKFRKKPVVIEAVQYKGNATEIMVFMKAKGFQKSLSEDQELIIPTLEGGLKAQIGDWIIKGIKGEFYPCKSEVFEATYEKVNDADSGN